MGAEATLTPEQVLISRVRGPAILQKLAHDWNIHPKTAAQARQLVELADALQEAQTAEGVTKAASADEDPFLTNVLSRVRQATGQPAIPEELFKQAAADLMAGDAEVAAAAGGYLDELAAMERQATQQV